MRRAWVQLNQQQQCEREVNIQVNVRTNNNAYKIHNQQALYTNNDVVSLEFSTSTNFIKLIVWAYKNVKRQYNQRIVRIQSGLCTVACEEISYGLRSPL